MTAPPEPIDLHHESMERVIGSYLIETDDGPALVDCGPASCLPALRAGLAARGVELTDIRHLLLTHIHLDHAGGTGALVREQPALQVHVSEVGAPHLVDPSRLERSARRLYGDRFDHLWGDLAPVPEANVRVTGDRVLGLEAFASPGHASHHACYLATDGTLFAGDATGIRIQPARHLVPATPPPDIDLEAWRKTFAEIERRFPARVALTHFGVADDVDWHISEARAMLELWAERVSGDMDEHQFTAAARWDLTATDEPVAPYYQHAAPFQLSYAGLRRYWDKRAEREGSG